MIKRGKKQMKKIAIRGVQDKPGISTAEILMAVVSASPHKALSVIEMRKRVAILDALEESKDKDFLMLEEAEHQLLAEAMQSFPWSQANKALLNIIDDVLNAETVSISNLKVVGKDGDSNSE